MASTACSTLVVQRCDLYVEVCAAPAEKQSVRKTTGPKGPSDASVRQSSSSEPGRCAAVSPTAGAIAVIFHLRPPVRAIGTGKRDNAKAPLPERSFSSKTNECYKGTALTFSDVRMFPTFYKILSSSERTDVDTKMEEGAGADEEPPEVGEWITELVNWCHETYTRHLDEGTWHALVPDVKGGAAAAGGRVGPSPLCRLFLSKPKGGNMQVVWDEEDLTDFILAQPKIGQKSRKGAKDGVHIELHIALAERDPLDDDTGDKYDRARAFGGIQEAGEEFGRAKPTSKKELEGAMAHILAWQGARASHADENDHQKQALFLFDNIQALVTQHSLWPTDWSRRIKTVVVQQTVARFSRCPTAAKRAMAAMRGWKQLITDTDWAEAERCREEGTKRRELSGIIFGWTPDHENWDAPLFRSLSPSLPPSLPPSLSRARSLSLPLAPLFKPTRSSGGSRAEPGKTLKPGYRATKRPSRRCSQWRDSRQERLGPARSREAVPSPRYCRHWSIGKAPQPRHKGALNGASL